MEGFYNPIGLNTGHVHKLSYGSIIIRSTVAIAVMCMNSSFSMLRGRERLHFEMAVVFVCVQCSLIMSVFTENLATCEIESAICFLNAKNVKPINIYQQICEVLLRQCNE